jgi:GNAT superfamily N-acetyltransferase
MLLWRLRLARARDATACADLVAGLVPELRLANPGIERFRASIGPDRQRKAITAGRYWVAEDAAGQLIGLAALRAPRHLFHLFVAERHQGRGLGGRLLATATAGDEHLPLTLNSSLGAIGFYTRLGFRPTQALQLADGIAFLPMRRP